IVCVRPGVLLARASALRPASALMALDLPTFERPANASSGGPPGGRSATRPTAHTKAARAKTDMAEAGNSNKIAPFSSGTPGMKRALGLAVALAAASVALAQDKAPGVASQVCAACHGPDGNSVAAANPKIAGQIPEYLQKQLRDFKAQDGKKPVRESAIMNGMVANLSDADVKGLAAFYAGQAQKPAAAADKELAALGQKLWRGGDSVH